MNYQKMLQQHVDAGADVTVATIEMDAAEAAGQFGVHRNRRDTGASSASRKNPRIPSVRTCIPDKVNASMGVYLFNTQLLVPILIADAEDPNLHARFRQRHPAAHHRQVSRLCLQLPR